MSELYPDAVRVQIPAKRVGPLAVHRAYNKDGYTISHSDTGLSLGDVFDEPLLQFGETVEIAEYLVTALSEKEWETLSPENPKKELRAIGERLRNAYFAWKLINY